MLDAFLAFAGKRVSRFGKTLEDPQAHLVCAEVVCAIEEMKAVLHHHMRVIGDYAARGDMPPTSDRIRWKFQSATVVERCRELAARLFMTTGALGLFESQPFGRILADINAARQHLANQYEALGRNWGRTLFGLEDNKDLIL
jgi:3-hydroxy-9,10-secoandrosta-1,3,5(10)-triene-9,17-dione monooxygenase